jgi:hypothetical protein
VKFFATAACVLACASAPVSAAPERAEAWGSGASEFEAVKSAYKKLLGDALKVTADRAAASDTSLRRAFVRELEEDLLRVQSTYFHGAPATKCSEAREGFDCHVVTRVQMDEIEARIRSMRAEIGGAQGTLETLRLGLVSKEIDTRGRDLVAYLHDELESDFGYDVLVSENYVDVAELRNGCREYERLYKEAAAKGDTHLKTAEHYRGSHKACQDMRDRDLILVLDSVTERFGAFSARDGMRAELTLRLQLQMTKESRPLPAPRPHTVTQFGKGPDADAARTSARNRLYEAAANYISSQLTEVLVNVRRDGRVLSEEPVARQYQVLVSGVNPDTKDGSAQLKLVTDWFAGPGNQPLEVDFTRGNFGERVYTFRASRAPDWASITDRLHSAIEQAGMFARLDVDRSLNLGIAFQPNDALKPKDSVEVIVEAKRARRRIAVEEREMALRRRDPETGTAIAVNEAALRILNKTSKDLLITVNPVWKGQDGSTLPSPYSHRQTVRLPAKSSQRFTFQAPSKFAGPVSIELSCLEKACEMPR